MALPDDTTLHHLKAQLTDWAVELGFSGIGVTDTELTEHEPRLRAWLAEGCHADMGYLARNVDMRIHPELLFAGTLRVVVVRMDYLPPLPDAGEATPQAADPAHTHQDGNNPDSHPTDVRQHHRSLDDPEQGYIARYALGRDYHKVLRKRLAVLAGKLGGAAAHLDHRFRVFTDSAPVLERALAVKAGLGWVGRHSLVLNKEAGSWFFLGEIFTNLPLPVDTPSPQDHCGQCRACVRVCPTDAIRPDRTIDARRCIAWLTIENKGAIPEPLRAAIGNRIFGCDDCQIFCPWNRQAPSTREADFSPRRQWMDARLDVLFAWTEDTFLQQTQGSAMRRVSYEQWQRNLAVALGNAPWRASRTALLQSRLTTATPLVAEHIRWALDQLERRKVER